MKKKKIVLIYLIVLTIFTPKIIKADTELQTYGSYTNAKKIIQEIMKDYYMRGPYIQYHHSKAQYGVNTPEDATSQEINYAVCANFVYGCYVRAFGMAGTGDNDNFYGEHIPKTSKQWNYAGAEYYTKIAEGTATDDCSYLVYFENDSNKFVCKHKTTNSITISSFAQDLRVGDILTYSGHTLVVYDIVERSSGNYDAIILNAVGGSSDVIASRINLATRKIFYNNSASTRGLNGVLDISNEGGVKWMWLSQIAPFFSNGLLSCSKKPCTVIRAFHNGSNGAEFNYPIDTSVYSNAKLRTEYPGLFIEKTVNKGDYNSIYPGDDLVYTIKIKNMSYVTNNGADAITYGTFYIDETLGNYVHYISSDGDINDNTITFTVNNLAPRAEVTLQYKVRVKKVGISPGKDSVVSNGIVYKNSSTKSVNITTGKVINFIIKKVSDPSISTYRSCFNKYRDSYSRLELIDQVYICARNLDFNFKSFDFTTFFRYDAKPNVTDEKQKVLLYSDSALNSTNLNFKKMILNKYWSGLTLFKSGKMNSSSGIVPKGTEYLRHIPSGWVNDNDYTRNRNINANDFKDGDVLIYYIKDGYLTNLYTNLINTYNTNNSESLKLPNDYYIYPYYENKTNDNMVDDENEEPDSDASYNKYYMYTKEEGLYAYVYVNGRFVGMNGNGSNKRVQFIHNYYDGVCSSFADSKSSTCTPDRGYSDLYAKSTTDEELLTFLNYQTLFGKDAYIILRPELVVNETINYIEDTNSLKYMLSGETFANLIERIDTAGSISILDANGNSISTSSKIRTGAKVTYTYQGKDSSNTIISVIGDTNGDGEVNSNDVTEGYKILRSKKTVSKEYKTAGDTNKDEVLKINDIAKLYQYTKGKINSLD